MLAFPANSRQAGTCPRQEVPASRLKLSFGCAIQKSFQAGPSTQARGGDRRLALCQAPGLHRIQWWGTTELESSAEVPRHEQNYSHHIHLKPKVNLSDLVAPASNKPSHYR